MVAWHPLTDEEIQAAVDAVARLGSQKKAAAELGLARSSLQARLKRGAERGMLGFEPVLPGYRLAKTTAVYGASGELERQFVQQRPDHGEAFEMPAGHVVKGVSALLDPEGRVVQQWVKTREDRAGMAEAIHEAFGAKLCPYLLPAAPETTDDDILTIYPIVDLHLGLFSWGKETGADYDLEIASDLLKRSVANLVARAANSSTAIILDMGDYIHADNSRNQTARSGNSLDVDTRYAKVCRVGVELAVHCIELALQKHATVVYRKLPGNHDDETSLMLSVALAAWFRNEPRVTIDTDPSRFFMHRFGRVMIAATHGDMLKMGDMAGFMAANWPREWGESDFRYAYTGHVHHDRVKSGGGVRAESFNTLAAKDAWHAGKGYTSARTAVAITMDREGGEKDRLTVSLPMMA